MSQFEAEAKGVQYEVTVKEKGGKNEPWISEAMLIALTPVIATGFCFSYELGRFHFYNVPWDLISVDITAIISASVGMLLFAKKKALSLIFGKISKVLGPIGAVFLPPLFAAFDAHLYSGDWQFSFKTFVVFLKLTAVLYVFRLLYDFIAGIQDPEEEQTPSNTTTPTELPCQGYVRKQLMKINWLKKLMSRCEEMKQNFFIRNLPEDAFLGAFDLTYIFPPDEESLLTKNHIKTVQTVLFMMVLLFCIGYWKARSDSVVDVLAIGDTSMVVVDITDKRIVCVPFTDDSANKTGYLIDKTIVYNLPLKLSDSLTYIPKSFDNGLVRSKNATSEDNEWFYPRSWVSSLFK